MAMLGDLAFRIVSAEERNSCLFPVLMSGAARRKKSETLSKTALGNDCLTEVAWNFLVCGVSGSQLPQRLQWGSNLYVEFTM